MPGALAVVGSNPTGPIESSVQSPIILKYPLSNQVHHGTKRDLYDRPKRPADWIKRVN
jgi:hypothetical protein